ncbi:MAG: hypothetical protein ACOCV1_00740 [Bacillota bacterium]
MININLDKTLIVQCDPNNLDLNGYTGEVKYNKYILDKLGYKNIIISENIEKTIGNGYNSLNYWELFSKLNSQIHLEDFEWIITIYPGGFLLKDKNEFQNQLNNFSIDENCNALFIRPLDEMIDRKGIYNICIFKASVISDFINILNNEFDSITSLNEYIDIIKEGKRGGSIDSSFFAKIFKENTETFNIERINNLCENNMLYLYMIVSSFIKDKYVLVPYADNTLNVHNEFIVNHMNDLKYIYFSNSKLEMNFIKIFIDKFVFKLNISDTYFPLYKDIDQLDLTNIRPPHLTEK